VTTFRRVASFAVCVGFTGAGVAWAEPTTAPDLTGYIEDPYAVHDTSGSEARIGTTVGFLYGETIPKVTALGITVAAGQRWNRLAIESEYSHLQLQEFGGSSLRLGTGERLAVIGRFDVVRLGPHVVGPNSLLALYVEGGAGVAWNSWWKPAYDQPDRVVPADSRHVEGQAGFGISLDHRLQEPITFPRRVGWFLGWRLAYAPHEAEASSICRGVSCRAMPTTTAGSTGSYIDRSMLFQSSLLFTW
jgi:hypothetical protein